MKQEDVKVGARVKHKLSGELGTIIQVNDVKIEFNDGSQGAFSIALLDLITETKTPKFKVGDKVKLNKYGEQTLGYSRGEGEIRSHRNNYDEYLVEFKVSPSDGFGSYSAWMRTEHLELILTAPQFKVGDRVRSKISGRLGYITHIYDQPYGVNNITVRFFDDMYLGCCSEQLELVEEVKQPQFKPADKVRLNKAGRQFFTGKAVGSIFYYIPQSDEYEVGFTDGSAFGISVCKVKECYLELMPEEVKQPQFKIGDRVQHYQYTKATDFVGEIIGIKDNKDSVFVVRWNATEFQSPNYAYQLRLAPTTKAINNQSKEKKKMKVSELMQDIVSAAEEKFGISDHINDYITISIGTPIPDSNEWGVSLARPTKRQLDSGEIENVASMKVMEKKYYRHHGVGSSLVAALLDLQEQVELAEYNDFDAE